MAHDPPATETPVYDRDARTSLLAVAERDGLCELADDLLDRLGEPTLVSGPESGLVMLQIREPVCGDRFHLGEVVVSRADVRWHGADGWAMRLGADRPAALAAALCDAAAGIDGDARRRVDELCRRTANDRRRADAAEAATLAPTTVTFEELD